MGQASQVLAEVRRFDRISGSPSTPDPMRASPRRTSARCFSKPAGTRPSCSAGGTTRSTSTPNKSPACATGAPPPADIARARFGTYGPLLRLGRTDEARAAAGMPPGIRGRPRYRHARLTSAPSPTPSTSAATATPPSAWNGTRCATSTWPKARPPSRPVTTTSASCSGLARQPAPPSRVTSPPP